MWESLDVYKLSIPASVWRSTVFRGVAIPLFTEKNGQGSYRNQAALPIFFCNIHACGCNQASEIEMFLLWLVSASLASSLDLPQTKKTKT